MTDQELMFSVVVAAITLPKLLGPVMTWLAGTADKVIKLIWDLGFRLVMVQEQINSGDVRAVRDYLATNAVSVTLGQRVVRDLRQTYARSVGGNVAVWHSMASEKNTQAAFLWRGRLVWLASGDDEQNARLRGLRLQGSLLHLLEAIATDATEVLARSRTEKRQYCVVRYDGQASDKPGEPPSARMTGGRANTPNGSPLLDVIGWPVEDLGAPMEPSDEAEALVRTSEMRKIFRVAKFWHKNRDWYQERQLPWSWGVCMYGDPGTGKTSTARGVAEELGIDVHIFNLAQMSNRDFQACWLMSCQTEERLVLVEDIDTVFNGRENITPGGLTFDTLLNAIDGVERQSGMLLVITTNDLSKVDPALAQVAEGDDGEGRSTRPGRVSMVVKLPPLGRAQRLKIAMRITRDPVMAAEVVDASEGETPDQITDRAIRAAQAALWAQLPPDDEDDSEPGEVAMQDAPTRVCRPEKEVTDVSLANEYAEPAPCSPPSDAEAA